MTQPPPMPGDLGDGYVGWPAALAAQYRESGVWAGVTLWDAFIERAAAHPDANALIDVDTTMTYAELRLAAERAGDSFVRSGIRPGDRIVCQLEAGCGFVSFFLGCMRVGIVPVLALAAHRRHELEHFVNHSGAVAIAVPDTVRDFDHRVLARELLASCETLRHVFVDGVPLTDQDPLLPVVTVEAIADHVSTNTSDRSLLTHAPDASHIALFLLSGGTTGLPKLIPRTHDDYLYNAQTSAAVSGLDGSTRYLVCLPVGHNFPLGCPGLLGTLLCGGTVVLITSPEPARAFDAVATHGITHTAVVPAVAARWLDAAADEQARAQLHTMRVLQVGGARLSSDHAVRLRNELGVQVQQVFGMAEGLLNYTRLDDPDETVCHTQGRPMSPDDEVRLVDESDRDVPSGERGSLLTRGPYTICGYYRAPMHNERSFTADGWYRSGDICRWSDTGNLVVEGRNNDMINRGGEKISAEEIEELVYRDPGVAQVAAIALPDGALGERTCIVVVQRPGASVTLDAIRTLIDTVGVARFKAPDELILVDVLPMTNIGKVDKQALRKQFTATTSSTTTGSTTISSEGGPE